MIIVTAISLLLSIVAVLIAIRSVHYTKRQTELMEKEEARKQLEDETTADWADKFDAAVHEVLKIAPKIFVTSSLGRAYVYIFSDPELMRRIETYLINADLGRNHFSARQASGEILRLPVVQKTIQEVLERVKHFRVTDPDNAGKLGL